MIVADIPVELMPIARRFAETPEFASPPLYTTLARVVARTPALLRLAARGRPGQYPTFLFFGAVHAVLLAGADHPLSQYYPSIAGDAVLPLEEAGPALVAFCACPGRLLHPALPSGSP